jgi:hypothetical protein
MGNRQTYTETSPQETLPSNGIVVDTSQHYLDYGRDVERKYKDVTVSTAAQALSGNRKLWIVIHPSLQKELVAAMKGQGFRVIEETIVEWSVVSVVFMKNDEVVYMNPLCKYKR